MNLPRIRRKWWELEAGKKEKETEKLTARRRLVVGTPEEKRNGWKNELLKKMLPHFPNSFQSESTSTVSPLTKIPHQRFKREWKSIKRGKEREKKF